ncbi:peptidoglycan-binding domain-containing protein [Bartonella tamiae]|uniref:Peptidoglycan binding-like domain-containing protein n=1 Tax=Bartonella tamiae Th239 TaxID=1094558 RepID=J0ZPQ1_9HYPH|nr:peptidoglycan-binding domain-containing protein [Bartonella tamiae]EJF90573.1 hypothetical protein ME5_00974 [Bartonella tamiae Th239]EJF94049.1 hypothetical protein MEG_00907 [Bartonella tamiae Th307]
MTKRRKTNRRQQKKRQTILVALMLSIGKVFGWVFRCLFYYSRKNPLLMGGYFLFLVGFSLIGFNAIFDQTSVHHGVFIKTRPNADINLENAQKKKIVTVFPDNPPSVIVPEKPDEDLATVSVQKIAQNDQVNYGELGKTLLDAQKTLTSLGLYDGPIDGLDGPKTKRALATWRQGKQEKQDTQSHQSASSQIKDDIAALIAEGSPDQTISKKTQKNDTDFDEIVTRSLPDEIKETHVKNAYKIETSSSSEQSHEVEDHYKADTTDILRVQAALRAFGNNNVEVTGKEDQRTKEALSDFQKMFSLSITGKINKEVLDKMKDVGLFG